jgi:hypothetical protein
MLPWYGINFLLQDGFLGFVILGSVFLCVTGAEALYADMGHFGRKPIQYAWLFIALPALLLNYFGQGAALLRNPELASVAFFAPIPDWAHWPMVGLATLAAIIASQAVITGVFSMTQQAVQLGQLPRMEIRHTSATDYGQIYVPRVNVLLAIGVVLIVLIFKNSDSLLAAYGIAVLAPRLCASPTEAAVAAVALGPPVALKARALLRHKSEVGGVVLNLRHFDSVRAAAEIMAEEVPRRAPGAPGAPPGPGGRNSGPAPIGPARASCGPWPRCRRPRAPGARHGGRRSGARWAGRASGAAPTPCPP